MPVGKTKDAGWQIGVSITVHRPAPEVWDWLIGPEGFGTWLGDDVELTGTKGESYETADGTHGELRSFRPLDRIRLTWQPPDWAHDSTIQIAIDDRGDRTRIVFHQERLASAEERAAQREHWKAVSERVRRGLTEEEPDG